MEAGRVRSRTGMRRYNPKEMRSLPFLRDFEGRRNRRNEFRARLARGEEKLRKMIGMTDE